ncbi:MAG TPA: hypothetical protein VH083_05840 [Myxococcales bacterium]|jgi:hypothetical protein|nr:hypothetical protein [Myxococcales bacterium]
MLRPSNSLLGSSRAARRANVRAERVKTLSALARWTRGTVGKTVSGVVGLLLLWGLPLLYLAASYQVIDLPARWLSGRGRFTWNELVIFLIAVIVGLVGLTRAIQGVPPVAPVRPKFARIMFGLSWVAGLLMTISDFVS